MRLSLMMVKILGMKTENYCAFSLSTIELSLLSLWVELSLYWVGF